MGFFFSWDQCQSKCALIEGCEPTIVPDLSTLHFYCSSYAFLHQSSSEQSAQAYLARCRLSLTTCVAGCWKSPSVDIARLEVLRLALHGRGLATAAGISRVPLVTVALATPNLSKTIHFVDMTELVQRRAFSLFGTTPRACAMPTPFAMVLTHWAHHPYLATCCTNTNVCKSMQIWIRELTRVECGVFADCDHHAKCSPSW